VATGNTNFVLNRRAPTLLARSPRSTGFLMETFTTRAAVNAVVRRQTSGAATLLASVEPRSTPDRCVLVSPTTARLVRVERFFHAARPVASLGEP
jgi:hypothetical protein